MKNRFITAFLILTFSIACSDQVELNNETVMGGSEMNMSTNNSEPYFCSDDGRSATFACSGSDSCLEYGQGLSDSDIMTLNSECEGDGNTIVSNCSSGSEVGGACDEGERLVIYYQSDSLAGYREGCSLDGYEWIDCP